jgi:hypothetical protein
MRRTPIGIPLLAALVICALWVAPASADSAYHTGHIAFSPIGEAPLSSGFVQNIHANGPNVYAHEIYQLNHAEPSTAYAVVLSIWTSNTSCSGAPTLQLATAELVTNRAGNGRTDVVFTPAAAGGLRGLTVSASWTIWKGTTATYATGCEVVSLD